VEHQYLGFNIFGRIWSCPILWEGVTLLWFAWAEKDRVVSTWGQVIFLRRLEQAPSPSKCRWNMQFSQFREEE
jgi:hypothetical protein